MVVVVILCLLKFKTGKIWVIDEQSFWGVGTLLLLFFNFFIFKFGCLLYFWGFFFFFSPLIIFKYI